VADRLNDTVADLHGFSPVSRSRNVVEHPSGDKTAHF